MIKDQAVDIVVRLDMAVTALEAAMEIIQRPGYAGSDAALPSYGWRSRLTYCATPATCAKKLSSE